MTWRFVCTLHTFSKVTVEIWNSYLYTTKVRGLEPRLSKHWTANYKTRTDQQSTSLPPPTTTLKAAQVPEQTRSHPFHNDSLSCPSPEYQNDPTRCHVQRPATAEAPSLSARALKCLPPPPSRKCSVPPCRTLAPHFWPHFWGIRSEWRCFSRCWPRQDRWTWHRVGSFWYSGKGQDRPTVIVEWRGPCLFGNLSRLSVSALNGYFWGCM